MSAAPLHTQAANFMDVIKTGVDPRTGQFMLAFQLSLIPANHLAGPSLSPVLSFSVLGSTRNRGYGLGWSLDLSEINLHQDAPALRLSSGEQFAIDVDTSHLEPGGEMAFLDVKLRSMVVTCVSDTVFRIDHKSGQTEFLTRQQDSARYLVSEIRSPEGRSLFVDWSSFANDDFILDRIRDESRTLLNVESGDGEVRFVVTGDASKTVRIRTINDKLSDVYLPGINTPFSILYDHHPLNNGGHLLLPVELTTPLGAADSVHWGTGDYGHQLPEGAPFNVLPRVTEWKHSAGTPDTELTRSYEWSGVHNFLGFGSEQAFNWQTSRDNLYDVEQDYDYEVVETQTNSKGRTLSTITRTWNRFHLLTREATRRGQCEIVRTTTFGIEPDTNWEDQPAWCQLPHKQTVSYIDHSANGLTRSEETVTRYDAFGNVLFVRTPNGVEEHSEYYPVTASEGCPASPLGMVRFLKKKTVKPARQPMGTYGGASEISTGYTYTSLASSKEDGHPFVVVDSETVRDETRSRIMETTNQTYVSEQGPLYARLASKVITLNYRATTTRLRYELTTQELSTHVTVRGFEDTDHVCATHSSARSLSTGQITRERSQAGTLSRFEYDSLGRLTLAVTADDSPYQMSRTTSYHINDEVALALRAVGENPVMIEHRLATGQRHRLWLDGEGRTVRIEVEDIDCAPDQFRQTTQTVFDAEGRAIRETQFDWLRAIDDETTATTLELTTTTEYDDWGQVKLSRSPDGVERHAQHDPINLTLRQWQQNGDLAGPSTLIYSNVSGSPVRKQFHAVDGTLVRTCEWTRDGLDRITRTVVKAPGQPDQITSFAHDAYGRVVEQRLADDSLVSWTYAPHSDDHHPETIVVTPPASPAERSLE